MFVVKESAELKKSIINNIIDFSSNIEIVDKICYLDIIWCKLISVGGPDINRKASVSGLKNYRLFRETKKVFRDIGKGREVF